MAYKRSKNRVNQTGRNDLTDRFVRLPYRILNSNAYRCLSCNARALLVEMIMLYNSENNGSLYMGVRDAAGRIGLADTTAANAALNELIETGFVTVTQDGHFRVKASETCRARCWRLNWVAGPGRRLASWDFLTREPAPRTKAYKRMERGNRVLKAYRKANDRGRLPVLDSDTLDLITPKPAPFAVSHSYTLKCANGCSLPKARIRDSATHIATPWGGEATAGQKGWRAPDWRENLGRTAFEAFLAIDHGSLAA